MTKTQLELPETGTEMATMTDVPSLVKLAIEKGVDVEVLERLVALQERVTDRLARTEFFRALKSFQDECPDLHKSKTAEITTKGGAKYGYSYAPLDGIAKTVRPILDKHGLSYSWTTEPSTDTRSINVVCILRHVEGHETRSTFPVPTETSAAMSAAQKNGAALTYGQRQSLVCVLGITATDDIDGAGDAETITEWQVEKLNNLITESEADFDRFLAYMGVERLDEITQDDFAKAVNSLKRKAAK